MNSLRPMRDTHTMVQKCSVFRSPTPHQDVHQSKQSSYSPLDSEYIRDTSLKNRCISISWKLHQNFDNLHCSQHPDLSINYQNNKNISTTFTLNTNITDQNTVSPLFLQPYFSTKCTALCFSISTLDLTTRPTLYINVTPPAAHKPEHPECNALKNVIYKK